MKLIKGLSILAVLGVFALPASAQEMTFFVTSDGPGNGGDLGGLAGADALCQSLAESAGRGDATWRAYLSQAASGSMQAVNARDRIGNGPWHNANGDLISRTTSVDFPIGPPDVDPFVPMLPAEDHDDSHRLIMDIVEHRIDSLILSNCNKSYSLDYEQKKEDLILKYKQL